MVLTKQKIFAVDTETTGTDPMRAELVGMSFSWQAGQAWYLAIKAPLGQKHLDIASVRKTDVLGRPIIDANKLRALLLDPNFSDPLRKVFTPKEMDYSVKTCFPGLVEHMESKCDDKNCLIHSEKYKQEKGFEIK